VALTPLFFFGVWGAVLLLIASALGLVVLETYYTSGELVIGYTFIVLLFGVDGIVTIFIGVTLSVLNRIADK